MLNVHQLNVFLVAADTLNFTQTAKKLHLTQSNVSQHIKSLENQFKVIPAENCGVICTAKAGDRAFRYPSVSFVVFLEPDGPGEG